MFSIEAVMAARMTDIVKQQGRAYRCLTCNFTSHKCQIEEHFFKRHVTEHQAPFLCSVCEFRTGDNAKLASIRSRPGHLARVELLENLVAPSGVVKPQVYGDGTGCCEVAKGEKF